MKTHRLYPLLALPALALMLAAGTALRAGDPPAPPTPENKPEAVQPVTAPAPAAQPTPAPVVAPEPVAAQTPAATPSPDEAARQLAEKARAEADKIAAKAQADAEQTADKARQTAEQAAAQAQATAEKNAESARAAAVETGANAVVAPEAPKKPSPDKTPKATEHVRHRGVRSDNAGDRVTIMEDNHVAEGVTVAHDAVAIMGDLTVDGEVMHDAVSVMGENTINGTVHHNAVAVMADLNLGPKAVVDGDIVCVGGEIHRDPGAKVRGSVQIKPLGDLGDLDQYAERAQSWWKHGLRLGRPLAIGAHLGWLWIATAFSVVFYAVLGLLFPNKIRNCGDKFAHEPGMAALAGLLGILALPVVFALLCITLIGIPIALFVLPVAVLLITLFGKAAIYGLVGRRMTGDKYHTAIAVVIGVLVFIVLFLVPVVGLLLSLLLWFLGFGCAVLSIFSKSPKPAPAAPGVTPPPAAPVPPVMPSAAPVIAPEAPAAEPSAPAAGALPPALAPVAPAAPLPLAADTLPRAGFWIRLGAAFLDFMLVMFSLLILVHGVFRGELDGPGGMFLAVAVYHVVLWKLRGATIGGIICGLRVVRLDDKPIDWGVAIVRALTAFLSFMMAGLGFIWVAFDDGKQSWHDKVAGTTVVRVPKGTSLL